MRRWWSNVVRDYFTFTKRERIAIFLFIIVGAIVYTSARLITPKKKVIVHDAFAKEIAQLKITIDSSSRQYRSYKNDDDDFDYNRPKEHFNKERNKGELFVFDPNSLDANGWKRLGLRDKTIQTIQNFLAKGYKFRQPQDIERIYGLHKDEAERLIPYIRIETNESVTGNNSLVFTASTPTNSKKHEFKAKVIDINSADTTEFISLPGIGSKLALRIVNFRDKLGGFVTVQQLGETYGVPDSTFQKIKPMLQCDNRVVKTIDLNAADVNQLKAHPYIKWNIANAIINYRKQHGNYNSLEELKRIEIITEEVYGKIAPYLKVL